LFYTYIFQKNIAIFILFIEILEKQIFNKHKYFNLSGIFIFYNFISINIWFKLGYYFIRLFNIIIQQVNIREKSNNQYNIIKIIFFCVKLFL